MRSAYYEKLHASNEVTSVNHWGFVLSN